MCTPFDLDYLGIAPVTHEGVGVGIVTLRFRDGHDLEPLTILLQRVALERLRDDIDSLLASNSVLSNDRTKSKAVLERVIVPTEVLSQFGVFDYKYTSAMVDRQEQAIQQLVPLPEEIKKLFRTSAELADQYSFVEEARSLLEKHSDHAIAALIWALRQNEYEINLLALELLRKYYTDAESTLPYVRSLISDEEASCVLVAAIETAGVMGDTSDELTQILTPLLQSRFERERVMAASNLWRISRSEEAWDILKRDAANGDHVAAAELERENLKDPDGSNA